MTLTADSRPIELDASGVFQPGHLEMPADWGREEFTAVAERLHSLEGSLQWWWGDLALRAEQLDEQGLLGIVPPEYREVFDHHRQWHWVAKTFPPHLRIVDNPGISWTHHRVVTSLDTEEERLGALEMAAGESWSTRELEDHVKNLKGAGDAGDPEEIEDPNRIGRDILVSVPADRDSDVEEVANLAKEFIRGELSSRGIPAGGQGFVVTVRAR